MASRMSRFALLAGLVYVAGTLFPVLPAEAATLGNLVCDEGEACVWEHDNYQGCFRDFVLPSKDSNWNDGDPRWANCDGKMNDKVSSYQNRSQYWFLMYEHADYVGNKFCGVPNGESNDLSNHGFEFSPEDRLSAQSYARGAPPRCLRTDNGPRCCEWRDDA